MINYRIVLVSLSVLLLVGCETFSEDLPWLKSMGGKDSEQAEAGEKKKINSVLLRDQSESAATKPASKPQPPPEVVEAAPAPESNLPEAERALPSRSEITGQVKFGDWIVECLKDRPCWAVHQLRVKNGQVLLQLTIAKADNNKPPEVTALLPLGFYLPDQAKIYFGTSAVYHQLTVQRCIQQGCIAISDNAFRLISVLKKDVSSQAVVVLKKKNRKDSFTINFSRKGFSEAYAYLGTLME
ncbi:MAG: invasion associated locus B family protein [Magnetococcales bacterium]|nr:invasion associated locus B family protein [Magnetococcales bacterium]